MDVRRFMAFVAEEIEAVAAPAENSWHLPLQPSGLQRLEVGGPSLVTVAAEFVEIVPAVEAGVVAIVEQDAHGVIAHRLQPRNLHRVLAGHDLLLAGGMTLHL